MAKSRDQLIDEALDLEQLRELPSRYCHCVWSSDIEGYVNLFTEDGEFVSSTGKTAKGRESIRQFIGNAMETDKPRPFIHNVVIELLGNGRARGWCAIELRRGAKNMEPGGVGYYDDEYEKVDGQWKFKSRKAIVTRLGVS